MATSVNSDNLLGRIFWILWNTLPFAVLAWFVYSIFIGEDVINQFVDGVVTAIMVLLSIWVAANWGSKGQKTEGK